jgi:hypothetical protein
LEELILVRLESTWLRRSGYIGLRWRSSLELVLLGTGFGNRFRGTRHVVLFSLMVGAEASISALRPSGNWRGNRAKMDVSFSAAKSVFARAALLSVEIDAVLKRMFTSSK